MTLFDSYREKLLRMGETLCPLFNMKSLNDLTEGEKKIETYLTFLARDRNVAPSTQNQALNALVFLYKHVLKQPLN